MGEVFFLEPVKGKKIRYQTKDDLLVDGPPYDVETSRTAKGYDWKKSKIHEHNGKIGDFH